MLEQITYYELVAHLIPGGFFLFIFQQLFTITIFSNLKTSLYNEVIVFIIVAYILGQIIHYFSKLIIEPILKKCWGGGYYSESFLFNYSKSLAFIKLAEENFGIHSEDLKEFINSRNINLKKKAKIESQFIFKVFSTFCQDRDISKKSEIQNAMYGFFRCMSFNCLLIMILLIVNSIYMGFTLEKNIMTVVFVILAITFIFRAKERGEYYVKEVFFSVQAYFTKKD